MARFAWNDACSVHVEFCDAQHKNLFAVINRLADAIRMNLSHHLVARTAGELLHSARTHCQQEEALLRKAHDPRLASHIAAHRALVARVEALCRQSRKARSSISPEAINQLHARLAQHIRTMDKACSTLLHAAGIR
jgi:hemerythrin